MDKINLLFPYKNTINCYKTVIHGGEKFYYFKINKKLEYKSNSNKTLGMHYNNINYDISLENGKTCIIHSRKNKTREILEFSHDLEEIDGTIYIRINEKNFKLKYAVIKINAIK
jgi:hypothetical protein